MADFDDIELSGLTEAQLAELSELIDPDVSVWLHTQHIPVLVIVAPIEFYTRSQSIYTQNHKVSYVLVTFLSPYDILYDSWTTNYRHSCQPLISHN